MYYDIIVESMIENCLTGIVYIDGNNIHEKYVDEDGKDAEGIIEKSFVEKIIKSVDYVPFLENIYDMIEYTREIEKNDKSKK